MTLALDDSPHACANCDSPRDLVLAGEQDVCRDCIPELAWFCWRCDTEPETEVVTTIFGPELRCRGCHDPVDAVMCADCECHVTVGQVERDEGDTFCRDCFENDDCGSCGGSGGGDHPGIRCLVCRGTGVDRSKKRRR